MEHINPAIDRSKWTSSKLGRGEPDKAQWIDDNTDLDCLAVRHQSSGHWCGYVGLPPGHPLHGKSYEEPNVDVHGGLTFADKCNESATPCTGICHIPLNGRPDDVWWFGFDCAHFGDRSPGFDIVGHTGKYRTLNYVKKQCAKLAVQLKAAQ